MFNRIVFIVFFLMFCASCFFFSSNSEHPKDSSSTVVDFTRVDVSPSFTICDSFIDDRKTACFRTEMHKQLTANLSENLIRVTRTIDEVVNVDLLINSEGKVSLQTVHSSKIIRTEIPALDSLLIASVNQLPILRPALKRGIPVTTQYTLPIRIFYQE